MPREKNTSSCSSACASPPCSNRSAPRSKVAANNSLTLMGLPASATIPFVKTTACGNDFLLIDAHHAPPDIAAFSRRICDRHLGAGADGVEWLFPDPINQADI